MKTRLYIFDADDTLRSTLVAGQPCPRGPDEWRLRAGVREKMRSIPWAPSGPYLGIASNQDQIGYGLLPEKMAQELLEAMVIEAAGSIVPRAFIRYCPHRLDESCDCRKPAPGMLLATMEHFGVVSEETIFVGNAESDCRAAANAGVVFVHARDFFAPRTFIDRAD